MLPDLPTVKMELLQALAQQYSEQALSREPLFKKLKRVRLHEGNTVTCGTEGAGKRTSPVKEHEMKLEFTADELLERGTNLVTGWLCNAVEQRNAELGKDLYDLLEAEAAAGSPFVGHGSGPVTPAALFDLLEKMEPDFDDDDNPRFDIIVSAEMYKEIAPQLPEWERDPCFKQKWDAIIERKRQAWHDRENSRKLVD